MNPIPAPYKLVLFDMDGTLVDSETIAHQEFSAMLGELGFEISFEDSIRRFAGRNIPKCLAEIGEERGAPLPDGFETEFRRRSAIAYEQRLRPFDGVIPLLDSIATDIAVASNGPRFKTEANLSITGLTAYFGDRVFSAYEVGSWKPEPGLFLAAAQSLACDPKDCLVIEDTETGFSAARDAGMDVMLHDPADHLPLPDTIRFSSFGQLESKTQAAYGRHIPRLSPQ